MTQPEVDLNLTPEMVSDLSGGQVAADHPALKYRIPGALADFRRYCGWHVFPNKEVTEVKSTRGDMEVQLRSLRVTAVRSVEIKSELDYIPLDEDVYEFDELGTLQFFSQPAESPLGLRWRQRFPNRLQGLRVKYDSGFNLDEIVHILVPLAAVIARGTNNFSGRTAYAVGQRSESFQLGGWSSAGARPFGDELAVWEDLKLPPEL